MKTIMPKCNTFIFYNLRYSSNEGAGQSNMLHPEVQSPLRQTEMLVSKWATRSCSMAYGFFFPIMLCFGWEHISNSLLCLPYHHSIFQRTCLSALSTCCCSAVKGGCPARAFKYERTHLRLHPYAPSPRAWYSCGLFLCIAIKNWFSWLIC